MTKKKTPPPGFLYLAAVFCSWDIAIPPKEEWLCRATIPLLGGVAL